MYDEFRRHVTRVVGVIKICKGEVVGPTLINILLQQQQQSQQKLSKIDIFARIPPETFSSAIAFLSMEMCVEKMADCQFEITIDPKSRKDPLLILAPLPRVVLTAYPLCRLYWRNRGCDFDVDTLAMDANSMYLLRDAAQISIVSDKLVHVIDRICSRRFCLLPNGVHAEGALFNQVARAYDMVRSMGWTMDDREMGRGTWIVASWGELVRTRDAWMKDEGPIVTCKGGGDVHMSCNDFCTLCHESFAPDDVVVNLSCRHTFHCCCSVGVGRDDDNATTASATASATRTPLSSASQRQQSTDTSPVRMNASATSCISNATATLGLLSWFALGQRTCPLCRATL